MAPDTVPGADLSAREIVAALGMSPHPEGGHFVETWRDVPPGGGRGAGTSIYHLLEAGQRSAWHRVDATEIWHWYGGAPLVLTLSADGRTTTGHRLGSRLLQGERPQLVIPPGCWQTAVSLGAWTLVGCTVSPAFVFEGFELAPPGWEPG